MARPGPGLDKPMLVKPGRTIADGRPVGRLILVARQTNALMRVLEGDMGRMALPIDRLGGWLHLAHQRRRPRQLLLPVHDAR